ncbi:hypothetical protein CASFOL_036861 [Castilleja foliolosa]|uniref:KIB1-4 beta-propeller domain-containing protein n=1 Tax=Castilleja foliolosa TaxID=1961234 RepID=A0ABD3BQ86_9LAMI
MSSSPSLFRPIFHRSSKCLISNNRISFSSFSNNRISFRSSSSLFRRRMSIAAALPSIIQNSPPWLMLPPAFDGGAMNFNFYSLSENKVITLAGSEEKELADLMSKPNHHRVLRGSSHGWLALFNKQNLDLFLYNPISRRHIKLPPIHNLPNVPEHDPRSVSKVILSCSPDQDSESCRAVMIHGDADLMAFCCPGRSKEWTSFGLNSSGYDECVYSSEQELLIGLTNDDKLESWDLRDLSSPRMIMSGKLYANNDPKSEEELSRKEAYDFCVREEHLVVAGHDLLNVTRQIMENVGPDGLYVDCNDKGSDNCPHLTVDFEVYKYDPDERGFFTCWDLDGLALFVGLESDTVALPASSFPGLKANSIYYTDTIGTRNWTSSHDGKCDEDAPFGGHDIGIFNYDDKTVSSCYYPCDVQSIQRILPSPMWFFPSSTL